MPGQTLGQTLVKRRTKTGKKRLLPDARARDPLPLLLLSTTRHPNRRFDQCFCTVDQNFDQNFDQQELLSSTRLEYQAVFEQHEAWFDRLRWSNGGQTVVKLKQWSKPCLNSMRPAL
jgi:hypothetical protein